jgi:hypothetical protein
MVDHFEALCYLGSLVEGPRKTILSAVPRFETETSRIRNYVKQSSFEEQMTKKPAPFMELEVSLLC